MFVRSALAVVALPLIAFSVSAETAEKSPAAPSQTAASATKSETPAKTTRLQKKELSYAEEHKLEMKRCMDAWDAGTSMTKTKWREICKRTLDERLPHKRATRSGTAPPKSSSR